MEGTGQENTWTKARGIAELMEAHGVNVRDVLDELGYIAYKLWTVDDIRQLMQSLNIMDSSNRRDREMVALEAADRVDRLEDCTDLDWMILHRAVREAMESLGYEDDDEEDD